MKYAYLLKILDQIGREAPAKYSKKYPKESSSEAQNQIRARTLIHLYLKVLFGITDFEEREHYLTDGGYDGGIDAYYIDRETRTIYLVQSKFRATEKNFDSKEITYDEIMAMDVSRVLEGEQYDENGNEYSGKIKQLQREVSQIDDIARYNYRVVLLANLQNPPLSKLRTLMGGFSVDVFEAERAYKELVFPVLTGAFFTASEITIPIDLSNKNAGSKISYTVKTKYADCEITVLFVPAAEIARIMYKYKNAILKYNPRSYLELDGQAVNQAIRSTVTGSSSNELALFNNGITMLSEETNINEKIGLKSKAQLHVKNPQIINGGQTSFTLSRIYHESLSTGVDVFCDKEIMLKVITVADCERDQKNKLIDSISEATNRQTPVINADRFANDSFHKRLQELVFSRYGLLYERKRGEFSDGVHDKYVDKDQIIERNQFWRVYYAANGDIDRAIQKKLFQRNKFDQNVLSDFDKLDRWHLGFLVYSALGDGLSHRVKFGRADYARILAAVEISTFSGVKITSESVDEMIRVANEFWKSFMASIHMKFAEDPERFPIRVRDRKGRLSEGAYFRNYAFIRDFKQAVERELASTAIGQGLTSDGQPA